jgi:Tol biopolymer transport system component
MKRLVVVVVLSVGELQCAFGASDGKPTLAVAREAVSRSASGDSLAPRISEHGNFVVFESLADNLVTNDAVRGWSDVFAYDVEGRVMELISASTNGVSGNGPSHSGALSADGRWVAFVSEASDLVPGDTNGLPDVFVRDRLEQRTQRVSVAMDGSAADGESAYPVMTPDGRWIAFESLAGNLVNHDTNGVRDVFVRDGQAGTTRRISEPSEDPAAAGQPIGDSRSARISDDGQTVAFLSSALNLVAGIPGEPAVAGVTNRIFVRRGDEAVRLVSLSAPTGTEPFTPSRGRFGLSADGGYLAFFEPQAFGGVRTNELHRLDVDSGGSEIVSSRWMDQLRPLDGLAATPALSADGGVIVYEVVEANVATGGRVQSTIYAWSSGQTIRVSSGGWTTPDGGEATELPWGEFLGMSKDGKVVAFIGGSTNDPPDSASDQLVLRHRETGALRRVTKSASGGPGRAVEFPAVTMSGDGSRVVFQSRAETLVEGDRNEAWDVFLYDAATDQVVLVSAAHPGIEVLAVGGDATPASRPFADTDALFVFTSRSPYLAPVDPNGGPDVFVRNRNVGTVELVSVDRSGERTGNASSWEPSISTNGQWVAFASMASNLVENDANARSDVFLRDRAARTTVLVSRGVNGTSPLAISRRPAISPDGRWVAFESRGSGLLEDESSPFDGIYLFESARQTVTLVTRTPGGVPSNGRSVNSVFSPDGRWLVFGTTAGNLLPVPSGTGQRVVAYNMEARVMRELSPASPVTGVLLPGPVPLVAFSPDGGHALFCETGTSSGDPTPLYLHSFLNGTTVEITQWGRPGSLTEGANRIAYTAMTGAAPRQVRVLDRSSGQHRDVSESPEGEPGDADSRDPLLSRDGRFVVFTSRAKNLVSGDTNGFSDLFIRDLEKETTTRVGGDSLSARITLASDGRTILFESFASDLVEGDFNHERDLFLIQLPGPESDFRVTRIERSSTPGEITLVWAVRDARDYRVEGVTDVEGAWQELSLEIRIEGGQATAIDRDAGINGRRFYRVREMR